MPITLLDGILVGFTLVSAMLAMVRGFSREVLSIASWAAAAIAAFLFYKPVVPYVQPYIDNEKIAMAAAAGIVFIVALIVVTIITMKIADFIIDSRIGALDRTLGFLFGLARGLLIVVVAFLFFVWLVPDKQRPDWVTQAKSRMVLQGTGDWLMSLLPDDPENTILKRLKKPGSDTDSGSLQGAPADEEGYAKSAREGLRDLIDGKPAAR